MGKKKKTIQALSYLVLLCFAGMALIAYFYYQEVQEVKRLNSQRKFLIHKLSEKVVATKEMEQQRDSLLRHVQQGAAADTAGAASGVVNKPEFD